MTKTDLTIKQFEHLIALSNLKLKNSEKESIRGMLSEAIEAVGVLDQLDTNNTLTLDHPTSLTNINREDEIKPSLTQNEALSNAKKTKGGYFVVEAIFEESNNA